MKKTILMLLMITLISGLALTGCSGAKTGDTLVVGLDDNFPPMGFRDESGEIVGFDIDMAKEAAKIMGVKVEFKPIDWGTKELELNGKNIDMIWNGLTITPERQKEMAFTEPYINQKQIIVVREGSVIKNKADLADKIIGLQAGSSSKNALEKDQQTLNSLKEVKEYPDNNEALLDLKIGRTDAVIIDEVVGRYYATKDPDAYTALDDDFGYESFGVGLRLEDKELLSKLQKALDEMKEKGTSAKISKKWFGKDIIN